MTVHEIIHSYDFVDLAVEYSREVAEMTESSDDIYCFHDLGGEYKLFHISTTP